MSLIDLFEKINVFLVKTVLGLVSMIANDMLFLKKLAVIHWKIGLVSLQFSVLHWCKAFFVSLIKCF